MLRCNRTEETHLMLSVANGGGGGGAKSTAVNNGNGVDNRRYSGMTAAVLPNRNNNNGNAVTVRIVEPSCNGAVSAEDKSAANGDVKVAALTPRDACITNGRVNPVAVAAAATDDEASPLVSDTKV